MTVTDSIFKKSECRPVVYAQLSKDNVKSIFRWTLIIIACIYVMMCTDLILSDKLMYILKALNFPLTIPLFTGYMYIVHY